MTKIAFGFILLVTSMQLALAPVAHAQFPITLTPREEINPNQAASIPLPRAYTLDDPQLSDIPLLLEYAIKFLLGLAGAVTIFFFISGAFEYIWMIPIEKKQEGKNRIIYSILGFVLVLLSYLIVDTLVKVIF